MNTDWKLMGFLGGLFATFMYISRIMIGERGKLYGRNRSLIRRIGSVLPLKPPPRFYLGPKARQSIGGMGDYDFYNSFMQDDSAYFVSYGDSRQQSHLNKKCEIRNSTPLKVHETEKLAVLEKEILDLQAMVQKLLMYHQSSLTTSKPEDEVALERQLPSTPLPPPPPPPIPPSLIPLPVNKVEKCSIISSESTTAPLSLKDVLKDMSKVKLRPVERSPGGNPKRYPVSVPENTNVLAAILKKRFAALHCNTPEQIQSSRFSDYSSYNDSQFDSDIKSTPQSAAVKLFS